MSRILRTYVIREVALPVLLALMTIIFILLMGKVRDLIALLMQPSVTIVQVAEVLLSFIPFLMVMAVPMAMLIGVLIGVGRMTLDREMLAARASGINLFSVFLPMIALGLVLSLTIMGLYSNLIPQVMGHGLKRLSQMQLAVITALEPGQFHDPKDMAISQSGIGDFEFFFRDRDPGDPNTMKGIMLKLEEETDAIRKEKKALEAKEKEAKEASKGKAVGKAPSPLDDIVSSATQAKADAALGGTGKDKSAGEASQPSVPVRGNMLTFITAESGGVTIGESDPQAKGLKKQTASMVLNLKNGSIHQYNPDPKERLYTTIRFKGLKKYLYGSTEVQKPWQALTNGELREIVADKDQEKSLRNSVRRELTQRFAISLASFVFILIGIPLAIWVRPSGKSWGILLAVGLMLVYYMIMNAGLNMIGYGKSVGYVVTFLPNLLFLALGAGLWWHTVRS